MKSKGEMVWLHGAERLLLKKCAGKFGWSKSRVLKTAFMRFVEKEAAKLAEQVCVRERIEDLMRENKELRRLQSAILRDHAYLKRYVRDLIYGSYEGPGQVKRRPPLLETPEAALSLEALQRILGRRSEIGQELCRLSVQLLAETAPYDVGPVPANTGHQVGLVAFPLCPYWLTSVYNRKFEGPPDQKWCAKKEKEVTVQVCWSCWRKSMKKKVENDPEWDSWRSSREYQGLRVFLDQFDFDENMEWLLRNNRRSVTTLNKPKRSYAKKRRNKQSELH